jgi:23S rRNA pseudouridine2605 synthase
VAVDSRAVRLQKVLAAAGIGSRRQCEEIIRQGRVDVDGQVVTELGTRVDSQKQQIRVDGQAVRRPKRLLYYAINKPVGILSTNNDPSGRPRVIDLAPTQQRLFTIGRLDKSSSGLILATNDGRLTDLLTHPRYGVEKTYLAEIAGTPPPEAIAKLERGVHLSEGFAHAKRVTVRRSHRHSATLEIVLDEGRNREVRRLLARIGHKVMKLKRVAIGPLRIGNLQPGESRPLTNDEVETLYRSAQERHKQDKPKSRSGKSTVDKSRPGTTTDDNDVLPIIDRSLPIDSMDDTELALNVPLNGGNALEEAETADVDLSPIKTGGSRGSARRTIIGGDQRRSRPLDKQRQKHRRRRRG